MKSRIRQQMLKGIPLKNYEVFGTINNWQKNNFDILVNTYIIIDIIIEEIFL